MCVQSDLFNVEKVAKQNKPVEQTSHYKVEYVFSDKDEIDALLEDTTSVTRGKMQQDFSDTTDFDKGSIEFQKALEKKAEEEHLQRVIEARAKINAPYFPNPKDDNEKLLNLQYNFLKSGSQADWWKLLEFSQVIMKRLVWHFMKQKKISLDEISQDEKVGIALVYVMRRYETTIGYYVSKNYISFLKGGVRHAFDYHNKTDDELLLDDKHERHTR